MELTEELAEDEGFKIDHEGFKAAMKEQQDRARASVVKGGSMGMQMKLSLILLNHLSSCMKRRLLKAV